MCLAIPMRVVATRSLFDDDSEPQVALVDSEGMRKEVRLDLADRIPTVGDYVIVHAGFVIHTLSEEEAQANLRLMREMAAKAGADHPDGEQP